MLETKAVVEFLSDGAFDGGTRFPEGERWGRTALNWLMTHFLLTLSFFGMILPVGGVIRLFGNDPLKREWDPNALSYWEEPEEQPAEFDRYLNQF